MTTANTTHIISVMNQTLEQSAKKLRKKRTKFPKHRYVVRAFKFAMDVAQARSKPLFGACDGLLILRNRLVDLKADERRANAKLVVEGRDAEAKWLTTGEIFALVSAWSKEEGCPFSGLHAHMLQDVVDRVEEGTRRWHDALKAGRGKDVKPPRHKEQKHYRSFTFKQFRNGWKIQNHRVFLSGFGWFKIHDHRKLEGRPATLTVKFAQGRWWCVVTTRSFETDWYDTFDAETDQRPDLGGDPGLSALLTTSDGARFDPPRALKDALARLRSAQKDVSRKFEARKADHAAAKASGGEPGPLKAQPYSRRLARNIRKVAKIHTKVERIRDYEQKKIASRLADTVGRLAVEEHGLQFMIRNRRLARSASDRAIGAFKSTLAATFGPGRYVATANQRAGIGGNSQTCLCGGRVEKTLSDRVHVCLACGLAAPRDMVSANIVQEIAFGTVSAEMRAVMAASQPERPVGGQPLVTRGGTEGALGESLRTERSARIALEAPVKRAPLPTTDQEVPRVGNLPRQARPVGNDRGVSQGLCRHEPKIHGVARIAQVGSSVL